MLDVALADQAAVREGAIKEMADALAEIEYERSESQVRALLHHHRPRFVLALLKVCPSRLKKRSATVADVLS